MKKKTIYWIGGIALIILIIFIIFCNYKPAIYGGGEKKSGCNINKGYFKLCSPFVKCSKETLF